MREFFHGWRRKVGCVTLVLALALMGGWVRSLEVWDMVALGFRIELYSQSGRISRIHRPNVPFGPIRWLSGESYFFAPDEEQDEFTTWRRSYAGFSISEGRQGEPYFAVHMPYLFLTLPMALLSAYLILWKPRKRTGPDHA